LFDNLTLHGFIRDEQYCLFKMGQSKVGKHVSRWKGEMMNVKTILRIAYNNHKMPSQVFKVSSFSLGNRMKVSKGNKCKSSVT
jgi:hypothetical protein